MKKCITCGNNEPDIWFSEIGECSVCNYERHKWEPDNLHFFAYCIICTERIYAPRVWDVHTILEDQGYEGLPICFECYDQLKGLIPTFLDFGKNVQEKIEKTKKPQKPLRGLQKWF